MTAGGVIMQHRVGGAADEQRRHGDLGAVELLGERPVAVEVAVPVDAAGEAGAGELGDVVVELLLGQPVGQPVGLGQPLDEAPAVVGEHRRHRLRGAPSAPRGRRACGASSSRDRRPARRRRRPAPGSTGCRRTCRRRPGASPAMGGIGPAGRNGTLMPDDAGHPLGVEQRQAPHDHRAPVVADEHGLLFADVVEQAEQVVGEVDDVVVLDGLGPARAARSPAGRARARGSPASARAGIWWRHEYASSGKPWARTTGKPSPAVDDVRARRRWWRPSSSWLPRRWCSRRDEGRGLEVGLGRERPIVEGERSAAARDRVVDPDRDVGAGRATEHLGEPLDGVALPRRPRCRCRSPPRRRRSRIPRSGSSG